MSISAPTLAQTALPMGPPTADEDAAARAAVAAAAPAPAAVAPAASAAPGKAPSWLAPKPAPKAAATGRSAVPSFGRMLGAVLVLGTLGIASLYFKRRGKGETKRVPSPKKLSVVSSTRIGPKAHAVVISVAGRQMLLGVTDSSVKRLAFIDEIEEEERELEREREPARRPASQAALRGAAIAVRTVTAEPVKPGFSDLLKAAFGKREPAPATDAASILAAETQDTVGGKAVAPSPSNVRMLDVEGQAQGLLRRLSGPRQ
ncbi:MAG TPA: flagellar biosynthetic protein FliO [Polyangiaceae bacterium]|nr:flagellar biosynthetic protein FliO [Polyangiaceae bacterium]